MPDPTSRGPFDLGEPSEGATPTPTDLSLRGPPPRSPGLPGWVRAAAVVAAVAVAAAAALAYRAHHRRKVLREGMSRAQSLIRADTWGGYREAARLLEPLARLDPVEAGAARAVALAMLFTDYREARAAEEAEALLVEPGRAQAVPESAQLAYAALALGRQEAGNAASFAARTQGPLGQTLQARTSLLAGNLGAAAEPLARAVEADPTLPTALALRGDVQRRSGILADARRSYEEALVASPTHARAAYGLAKLALGGQADPARAQEVLARLAEDREGTAPNERGRAALYLAALRARAGDRAGAAAAFERAGVDASARAWLEKAAAELELSRGTYRMVPGAPASLLSASDDDPYLPPPPRAEPRAEPKKAAAAPAKKKPTKATSKKPPPKKKKPTKAPAKKTEASKKKPKPKPKPPPKKAEPAEKQGG